MIAQETADGFLALCEFVLASGQPRPALAAFTHMERHWAHKLRTGEHRQVPRPVVMAAMAAAWDIAKANPVPSSYAPQVPGTSALSTWLQDDFGAILEMTCRWALDSYTEGRRVGAAVLLAGNLAMAGAARASAYSTAAHAALEALTAGASIVVPVVEMMRTLIPSSELAGLAIAPHPYAGRVERGDLVHVGIPVPQGIPGVEGVEMLPVQVSQVDDGGHAVGIVAADPIAPAVCGYRVGMLVPFHAHNVFELVEAGSAGGARGGLN